MSFFELQLALNWGTFASMGGTIFYYVVMLGEHSDCPQQTTTYGCLAYNTVIGYLGVAFFGYFSFLSNKTSINGKVEEGKGKGKIEGTGSYVFYLLVEPQFAHL